MRTVYKYPLNFGRNTLTLPTGAVFLHFAEQRGDLCAWFEVYTQDTKYVCERTFQIFGTGWEIPEDGSRSGTQYEYRATCLAGPYVWHLYEVYEVHRPSLIVAHRANVEEGHELLTVSVAA